MFAHHVYEAPGERLLLVQMEARPNFPTQHRHIVAYVVRRACSDVPSKANPSTFDAWYDGKVAEGYRSANWHVGNNRKHPIYVANLQVRAQIDAYMPLREKLAGGAPYGADVVFKPYELKSECALAMADFFARFQKHLKKVHAGGVRTELQNDFFTKLLQVWSFLNFEKFVFGISNSSYSGLGNPQHFVETNFKDGLAYIQANMLDEFLVKTHE